MTRRQLRAVLALPLLAGLLAGCGSDEEPGPDEPPGSAAVGSEPSERSERLREDLAGACPAPSPDGGASSDGGQPDLAWLDVADGAPADQTLQAAADGAQEDLGLTVSVGVRDRETVRTTTGGEQRTYPSASLSKVPVVLAFLGQQRAAGLEITDEERSLIEATLVSSDNDAAFALYARLGALPEQQRAALQETYDQIGTSNGASSEMPGLNQTSVADQLLVVAALQDRPEWLHPDDADLVAEFMAVPAPGREVPDESKDFGVGSLALPLDDPAAEAVHAKNGWIDDAYDGTGAWSAGTVGYAEVRGTSLDLVVLLDGAPSYDCAFSALDAVTHVAAQTAGG